MLYFIQSYFDARNTVFNVVGIINNLSKIDAMW